jgi:SpoVK/Ycf46/Vps4 family AAA+-type ATPase
VHWPKIDVPASLIFAKGFDHMEAQANHVFDRLNHLRRCVIFFDEFEEFFVSRVPEHGLETSDHSYKMRTIAAFTSAMLPRLQQLHDQQRCIITKAADQLGVSQPAISKVIADLECAFGVRLLDRGRNGVAPTNYGDALLKRSLVAFDELRQSVRDIEFLADPTKGDVKLQCHESIAATFLPHIIRQFSAIYPHVVLHVCMKRISRSTASS